MVSKWPRGAGRTRPSSHAALQDHGEETAAPLRSWLGRQWAQPGAQGPLALGGEGKVEE